MTDPSPWHIVTPHGDYRQAFTTDELDAFEKEGREVLRRASRIGAVSLGEADTWTAFPFGAYLRGKNTSAFAHLRALLDTMEELCAKLEESRP